MEKERQKKGHLYYLRKRLQIGDVQVEVWDRSDGGVRIEVNGSADLPALLKEIQKEVKGDEKGEERVLSDG